jgi:hypothetical protein
MMFKKSRINIIAICLALVLTLSFSLPVMAANPVATNEITYLQDTYHITLNSISTGEYKKLLSTLLQDDSLKALPNETKEKLTSLSAIKVAINAVKMDELAKTYTVEKINRAFKNIKIAYTAETKTFSFEDAQKIALALDLNLLDSTSKTKIINNNEFASSEIAYLTTRILDCQGKYKNYLGKTLDDNIYGKVLNGITLSKKVSDPKLNKVLDQAVKANIVTGYNLRDTKNYSNFIPALTLRYGHDNGIHALQLIGLLRSEGINAKVNIETKTSAYVYLKEWGTIGLNNTIELLPMRRNMIYCLNFRMLQQKLSFKI